MKSVNKVMLIGVMGKDADLKLVGENKKVTKLSVATSESYKDAAGEKKTLTEWHDVECWGDLAQFMGEYAKKGTTLYVEGKLKTVTYEKEGVKQYRKIIVATEINLLKSPSDKPQVNEAGVAAKQAENYASTPAVANESFAAQGNDDLPF